MSDFVSNLANKSPELLVILVLVWMFLRSMRDRDMAIRERDTLFIAAIRQVSEQHMEAREQARQVIQENSVHTLEATKALVSMTEVLRTINPQPVNKVDPPLRAG